jgi:transposase
MVRLEKNQLILAGPTGTLAIPDEEIMRKWAMLYEGQCEGLGPTRAAEKFGYTKQRYFQILHAFQAHGTDALRSRKRGPKTRHRRTPEVVQEIIRHRFLDPDASADVIAQKLRQTGQPISTRSVERTITEWGLQKKTPRLPAEGRHGSNAAHQTRCARRTVR